MDFVDLCNGKEGKSQPWKANWPPRKEGARSGKEHMLNEEGNLLIDGVHNYSGAMDFVDLCAN